MNTNFYVRCPQCGGACEYEHDGELHECLCVGGFIETGYTEERVDALVSDVDQLLMLIADLMDERIGAWKRAEGLLRDWADDLVAARTRTLPKK